MNKPSPDVDELYKTGMRKVPGTIPGLHIVVQRRKKLQSCCRETTGRLFGPDAPPHASAIGARPPYRGAAFLSAPETQSLRQTLAPV